MKIKKRVFKLICLLLMIIICALFYRGFIKQFADEVRYEISAKSLGQYKKEYAKYFADTLEENGAKLNNYMQFKNVIIDASSNIEKVGNICDGKKGTKWISYKQGMKQYFQVCLGNAYVISKAYLAWDIQSSGNYSIEISADGKKYISLGNVETNGYKKVDEISFAPNIEAAYLRITMEGQKENQSYEISEFAIFGQDKEKKEKVFDKIERQISNLEVVDYYKYTGKYFLYFTEQTGAAEYEVSIDDIFVKCIKGSGDCIGDTDIPGLSKGTHNISVSVKNEGEPVSVSASLDYKNDAGDFSDISQIYIYTNEKITTDYSSENVVVSVVDEADNSNMARGNCKIKIRGNTTAKAKKKPYNIKFADKTSLLGMNEAKKWCLLANQFDKSLMRNYLVLKLGSKIGLKYTPDCRYADVYVNGVYAGNYLATEAVEVKKNRVEVDAENEKSSDSLIEVGSRNEEGVRNFRTPVYDELFDINNPEEEDLTVEEMDEKVENISSMIKNFENALHSRKYNKVKKYFDEQSFVDFYIVCELFKNVDFSFSSTRFYIKDNRLYAGPLWDFDLSSGNLNPNVYIDYYIDGDSSKGLFCDRFAWYSKLMEMPGFKKALKKRYKEIKPVIKEIYSVKSNAEGSINYALDNFKDSFLRNYISQERNGAGWSLINMEEKMSYSQISGWTSFDDSVDHLREWLKNRDTYLTNYFKSLS